MVIVILGVALLIAIAALAVEIGITSWNIRQANRYQRELITTKDQAESMRKQAEHNFDAFHSLDKYATDISWLVKFLYNRYDKFADIDKEIEEGIKSLSEEAPLEEASKRYADVKQAMKLVKVSVRASERTEEFSDSIASHIYSIMYEMKDGNQSM